MHQAEHHQAGWGMFSGKWHATMWPGASSSSGGGTVRHTSCAFQHRVWKAQEVCRTVPPPLEELAPGHVVACHFPENTPQPA